MRRTAALVTVVGLALATTAGARTITGSSRAETLRGSAGADVIYGKQGKDALYGGRGNDLLVPGAGPDAVHCGPGRDMVRADSADTVARDCEAVARAGAYAGLSSQNEKVTFRVLPGATRLTAFRINSVNQSCQPRTDSRSSVLSTTAAPSSASPTTAASSPRTVARAR